MATQILTAPHRGLARLCSSLVASKTPRPVPLMESMRCVPKHYPLVPSPARRSLLLTAQVASVSKRFISSRSAHVPKATAGDAGDSVPLPPPSNSDKAKSELRLPPAIRKTVQNSVADYTQSLLKVVISAGVAYDRSLQTHPVITKATTCFITFMIGDIIAQNFQGKDPIDLMRMVRLGLYGLLIDGPVGHVWYTWLDKNVYPEDPNSNKAVLTKTAADQLIWSVLMTPVFFATLRLLEGRPDLILSTIERKMLPTLLANYMVWPLAHLINFKFVPTNYRLLYNNIICIAWTTFMSWITYQAVHRY